MKVKSILSARSNGRMSPAVILSYIFDWVVLIVIAVLGAIFSNQTPNKRPFSLANADISFPYVQNEKISTGLLVVLGLAVPAVIIAFVAIVFVPGPTVPKSTPKLLIWKRKLWELHTGWLGLALALALAFITTNGMKNLFGRPRPDLLSRCQPDLGSVDKWTVGGISTINGGIGLLVSAGICQQTDTSLLDDGFRSYPSGHASFSSAGLLYLSLFLASKFAITIPFLAPRPYTKDNLAYHSAFPSQKQQQRSQNTVTEVADSPNKDVHVSEFNSGTDDSLVAARNQAAAPPLYLLGIAIIPFFLSVYISSTRFSDFRHHGFDILFGFFIGSTYAITSFRFYHLPISQGAGWSWGPRSRDRSFWAGIGVGSYVSEDRIKTEADLERGTTDVSRLPIEQRAGAI